MSLNMLALKGIVMFCYATSIKIGADVRGKGCHLSVRVIKSEQKIVKNKCSYPIVF